jgi:hypothetical protein
MRVFLAEHFFGVLVLAIGAENFAGDGLAAFFGRAAHR